MNGQILIDAKLLEKYCSGSDQERALIDSLYPNIFSGIKEKMFLRMLREYKTQPDNVWFFNTEDRGKTVRVTLIVEE